MLIKIQEAYRTWMNNIKPFVEKPKSRIAKSNLYNKITLGDITISDFKVYYRSILIKLKIVQGVGIKPGESN